ncbi:Glycosyltransferase sugar-binding region containing DXD motif family protein [Aspergillus niger]|uniref:Glycosyltransferase sugar-binding region containing DXD motif family protein n=1 Tax=Aspergillus niger TaxID=5061 RepID=A0A505HR44_ASPNG|nr:Glycosyltransferase sugar-binding region containing DXD motif family protein [Aspergillus niger]
MAHTLDDYTIAWICALPLEVLVTSSRSGTIWPVLGIQPLNHLQHATQIIVEATALLELDSTKRAKLPGTSLEAFLNSVINLAKKAREQPSGQEILGKLNSLQPIVEDIILIKNAVNNALASPAPSGRARLHTRRHRTAEPPQTASVRDRETVVKLDANAAAVLRQVSSEDLCKRVNDALGSRINLLGKAPQAIAAKQLKSGDVVLHTATTAEADTLKDTEEEWVKVLGTSARVVRPTYGVIVHGVRTSKESIDTDN